MFGRITMRPLRRLTLPSGHPLSYPLTDILALTDRGYMPRIIAPLRNISLPRSFLLSVWQIAL